jgi:hypothetical protein
MFGGYCRWRTAKRRTGKISAWRYQYLAAISKINIGGGVNRKM